MFDDDRSPSDYMVGVPSLDSFPGETKAERLRKRAERRKVRKRQYYNAKKQFDARNKARRLR